MKVFIKIFLAFFIFGISSTAGAWTRNCQVMICSNIRAFDSDELNEPTETWQGCRALAYRYVNRVNATSRYIIYAQWSYGRNESRCQPLFFTQRNAGYALPD